MEVLTALLTEAQPWLPFTLVLVGSIIGLLLVRRYLFGRSPVLGQRGLLLQLFMVALTGIAVLVVILSLPLGDTVRGQLLTLLGLFVTAAITLASGTFVGNAMSGMMLQAVRSFRLGDFIEVGEHFGRVTERGLLHTEIQTDHRNLTTLPNLYLVQNPVMVVRGSGTVISTDVSLGYDIPRTKIEDAMLTAVSRAGLSEPFVHVMNLGDYSVAYRAAGLLEDVTLVISARARLRAAVLDELHAANIEIVSPTFMNQRVYEPDARFLSELNERDMHRNVGRPERLLFDKAYVAQSRLTMEDRLDALRGRLGELKTRLDECKDDDERDSLTRERDRMQRKYDIIEEWLHQTPEED